MVIITLALVPIIHNLGGPTSAQGNAARVVGQQSKEILLANTLIEQALANDYKTFNCNSTFNTSSFPTPGQSTNFPAGSRCVNNSYNQALYYQWTVHNTAQASALPTGNNYYNAVLNVYSTPSGGTSILTMPTSFFYNSSGLTTVANTGIMIVQDISGSMAYSQPGAAGHLPVNGSTASPYLRYRYDDPALGYYPASNNLGNLYNNKNLDILVAANADDPATPWNDMFLKPGVSGAPNCSTLGGPAWTNSSNFFNAGTGLNATQQGIVSDICNRTGNFWNNNLSRLEASRASLLQFLVSIENDPQLYVTTKIGLSTFSDGGSYPPNGSLERVPLESVNASKQYVKMRRALSWINRGGPGNIPYGGGTWMYQAMQYGADKIFADSSVNNRIILLVTDGLPNGPQSNHPSFSALGKQIGDGTYPGAKGNKATIMTLGLLEDQVAIKPWLDDDLASQTTGGQFFYAQKVADISPIFDQIKYQIQRLILLQSSDRYQVNFR